jgi:hypothetical protein
MVCYVLRCVLGWDVVQVVKTRPELRIGRNSKLMGFWVPTGA